MITMITLSTMTIAVVSTVTIGILSSVLLIGLLATKEILQASTVEKHKILSHHLIIGITPLLIGFAVIVVAKVLEILS